ncbi:hypothetical protein ACMFAW_02900 [Citrobacter koseri]|uniref:hypothetical protein n=1 Tax=Citrobacter koseri TaxID=545 RepID=UPI001DFB4BFE|nr:hypothetical protein [Citrobacter koseri]MDT7494498.1 hypothetical protein [Citrobacter koseri]CAG0244912.1 hypothetical protein AN2351V1_1690 [Citrobacter koseri]CAH6028328.1 hypothetical protein AN2351V1_1690 [Citrobacter koseri]HEM6872298.1 hypothetical protein [Citrobacter koseri]
MSANELALRFSTAPAEELIGVLPVREVKEALRDEVEDDVLGEVWTEHNFEMEAVEVVADAFGTAIKLALTLPHDEAIKVLTDAINTHQGYGQEPEKS